LDKRGELVGVVVDVYDDPSTRRSAWLAISTGFFGTRVGVVPLHGASLLGDDVVIPYTRHVVTSAPRVDVIVTVDPDQQQWLIDHYATASGSPERMHHHPESST